MADEVTTDDRPRRRLNNIALSLSGGGVRAVGFHLGLLEMLDRLGLLERVTILSTVSGGSLTGTGYALAQHYGHSFDRYFGEFYEFLPEINTIEELLKRVSSGEAPAPSGRRDMITALANLYDDEYFNKYFGDGGADSSPRFGVFWGEDSASHLKEIIFNATEFQTGTAFRFQKSQFRSLVGNANIFLCDEHAQMIRMADIMAASCCVPVGMEPLFFPDDFHWPDDVGRGAHALRPTCNDIKDHLRENLNQSFRLHEKSEVDFFALMDGGVYDNQGIMSLLLAMNRLVTKHPPEPTDHCICGENLHEDREPLGPEEWARWLVGHVAESEDEDAKSPETAGWRDVDLLIISDTPVRKDSLYPKLADSRNPDNPEDELNLPSEHPGREKHGWASHITIGGVERVLQGLTVLLFASAIFTAYQEFIVDPKPFVLDLRSILNAVLQVGIPLFLPIGVGIGLILLRMKVGGLSNKIYGALPKDRWGTKKPWDYIKRIKLENLISMFRLRLGSATALTSSIYMNRIRSLSYSALFSRQRLDEHVLTNEIFALEDTSNGRPSDWPEDFPDHIAPLSEDASAIILLAAHMQTKLWINRIDKGVEDYAERVQGDAPLNKATRRVLDMNEKREANSLKPLNDLDVLVISGQLTSCYKLMVHAWKNLGTEGGSWMGEDAEHFFEQACSVWRRIHDDPVGLLDDRKRRSHEALRAEDPDSRTFVLD